MSPLKLPLFYFFSSTVAQLQYQHAELLLICSIVVSSILIGFIVFFFRFNKIKSKELHVLLKEIELFKSEIIENKKVISSFKQTEIIKEREFIAINLELANIQSSIGVIIDEATMHSQQIKEPKFINLIKDIRFVLSRKDYWNEFRLKFTQTHPNFNTALKARFPNLSPKDISFCSLIKLNLLNKEIASMLQVSHESVITKKYLLKKKLKLTADQDLIKIINDFD